MGNNFGNTYNYVTTNNRYVPSKENDKYLRDADGNNAEIEWKESSDECSDEEIVQKVEDSISPALTSNIRTIMAGRRGNSASKKSAPTVLSTALSDTPAPTTMPEMNDSNHTAWPALMPKFDILKRKSTAAAANERYLKTARVAATVTKRNTAEDDTPQTPQGTSPDSSFDASQSPWLAFKDAPLSMVSSFWPFAPASKTTSEKTATTLELVGATAKAANKKDAFSKPSTSTKRLNAKSLFDADDCFKDVPLSSSLWPSSLAPASKTASEKTATTLDPVATTAKAANKKDALRKPSSASTRTKRPNAKSADAFDCFKDVPLSSSLWPSSLSVKTSAKTIVKPSLEPVAATAKAVNKKNALNKQATTKRTNAKSAEVVEGFKDVPLSSSLWPSTSKTTATVNPSLEPVAATVETADKKDVYNKTATTMSTNCPDARSVETGDVFEGVPLPIVSSLPAPTKTSAKPAPSEAVLTRRTPRTVRSASMKHHKLF